MKKAIIIRAFSANSDFLGNADFLRTEDDFARCFERAAELGFEGVQLYVARHGYLTLDSDEARVRGGVSLCAVW